MLTKQFVLSSLILLFSRHLSAQIADLLKNRDITWVAEINTDFIVDNPDLAEEKNLNHIRTLKLLPNPNISGLDDRLEFANILLEAIYSKKIAIYDDSTCQNPMDFRRFAGADTITQIDPITYETKIVAVERRHGTWSFRYLRVRQIVFYDAKRAQFGLRTLAIAPFIPPYFDGVDTISPILCWLKAEDLEKRPHLSSDDITWARELVAHNGIDFEKAKVLKKTSDDMPINHLLNVFEKDMKKRFFKANGHLEPIEMTPDERRNLLIRVDTVSKIDPTTFEVTLKVIKSHIQADEPLTVQLVQEWFWNARRQKLGIRLVKVSVMKDLKDYEGNLLVRQPIFYRRTDKD